MKAHLLGTPTRKTSRKDILKRLETVKNIMNIANGKALNGSVKDISKEESKNGEGKTEVTSR